MCFVLCSDKPVTGYSLYNVQPEKAAFYFNKIQCFCFEEQRLRAHESVDMPVLFYIDPEFATDWNCRKINDITLSYSFHKVRRAWHRTPLQWTVCVRHTVCADSSVTA